VLFECGQQALEELQLGGLIQPLRLSTRDIRIGVAHADRQARPLVYFQLDTHA
jgi:hypothetical protein